MLINGKNYVVPMVIEESSVVAAASAAAKFWSERGGFHAEVVDVKKMGQVHFCWNGRKEVIKGLMPDIRKKLLSDAEDITVNMRRRGGGVVDIQLVDFTDRMKNYYQLLVSFDTCNSMGANFINSVLESFAHSLQDFLLVIMTWKIMNAVLR